MDVASGASLVVGIAVGNVGENPQLALVVVWLGADAKVLFVVGRKDDERRWVGCSDCRCALYAICVAWADTF